jgi:hypothetical protein
MELFKSLPREAISAAGQLREKMAGWLTSDKALESLAERFPEFDEASTLLKTVAINALYSTNLYAIERMAEHITGIMERAAGYLSNPEIVENIANLPNTDTQKRHRRHYSFASKFAHFFIDPEAFPIKDSYAVAMLEYHLGKKSLIADTEKQYLAYVESYERLKEGLGFEVSNKDLDRYLWIAGELKVWMKDKNAAINGELKGLFEAHYNDSKDIQVLHETLEVN